MALLQRPLCIQESIPSPWTLTDEVDRLSPTAPENLHQVYRSNQPMSEYSQYHAILLGTYPFLFLRGEAPFDPGQVSPLTQAQRRHVLLQFSGQFARSHDLILTLDNTDTRRAVNMISNVKLKTAGFKQFQNFVASNGTMGLVEQAIKDPTGPEARKLLLELQPMLSITAQHIPYTNAARQASVVKLFSFVHVFGPPSLFVTFAPDDKNHGISVRLGMIPKGNLDLATTGQGLMEAIRNGDNALASVNIELQELHRLVAGNPVAAVLYFYRLLRVVLTRLFGLAPISDTRRTLLPGLRPKGLFGRVLAYGGVVETTSRGALHFHGAIFTDLSAHMLQDVAHLPHMKGAIQQVLDSLVTAHIPLGRHLENILSKVYRSEAPKYRPVHHVDKVAPAPDEPLDQWLDRIVHMAECTCGALGIHDHTESCRLGKFGMVGCRYAKPEDVWGGPTAIVQIDLSTEYKVRTMDCRQSVLPAGSLADPLPRCLSQEYLTALKKHAKSKDSARPKAPDPKSRVLEISLTGPPPRLPRNAAPLYNQDDRILVVRFHRPSIELLPELQAAFQQDTPVSGTATGLSEPLVDLLNAMPTEQRRALATVLRGRNGLVVDFNRVLSAALGCNTNVSFLGARCQAMNGIFYVFKYMRKDEQKLNASLVLIRDSLRHVRDYPSTAADSGTDRRTALYFLQNLTNRVNGAKEVPVTMSAAKLLGFDAEVMSHHTQQVYMANALDVANDLRPSQLPADDRLVLSPEDSNVSNACSVTIVGDDISDDTMVSHHAHGCTPVGTDNLTSVVSLSAVRVPELGACRLQRPRHGRQAAQFGGLPGAAGPRRRPDEPPEEGPGRPTGQVRLRRHRQCWHLPHLSRQAQQPGWSPACGQLPFPWH